MVAGRDIRLCRDYQIAAADVLAGGCGLDIANPVLELDVSGDLKVRTAVHNIDHAAVATDLEAAVYVERRRSGTGPTQDSTVYVDGVGSRRGESGFPEAIFRVDGKAAAVEQPGPVCNGTRRLTPDFAMRVERASNGRISKAALIWAAAA